MNLSVIDQARNVIEIDLINNIINTEKKIKELQEIQTQYKDAIKKEMEKRGLLGLKDEETGLFINYNQAKTNIEKFNAKELKEKMPDIYDEFVSFDGKRASYITIKY